jgi:hypothetical protein
MIYLKTLARAAGLGLCVAALSGTALADPGNGNGNGPATTPPGQEKKAETPAAPAPTAAPRAAQAQDDKGQEKKAENQAKHAAKKVAPKPAAKSKSSSAAAKAAAPGQAKKAEKQAAKAATPAKGQSADAHHHVIVCHRTGSLSNPYVVINIPYTAWTHGHTTHPAKNGHSDKLLKDPASRPGSKDGFDKSDCGAASAPATTQVTQTVETKTEAQGCPASATTTDRVLVGVWHATGAVENGQRKFVYITPSLGSAHYDTSKHSDDIPVYEERTVSATASAESCKTATTPAQNVTPPTSNVLKAEQPQPLVPTAPGQTVAPGTIGVLPAVGGVAGAVSPAGTAAETKQAEKPAGGVLGAVASAPEAVAETATSGTLPFTGIPLWIAALIGGALLTAGLVLRRAS